MIRFFMLHKLMTILFRFFIFFITANVEKKLIILLYIIITFNISQFNVKISNSYSEMKINQFKPKIYIHTLKYLKIKVTVENI